MERSFVGSCIGRILNRTWERSRPATDGLFSFCPIDDANANFGTVTVIPLTKLEGKGRSARFYEVELPAGTIPNGFTSLALPHQIRSVSKNRLLERIGTLDVLDAQHEVECGILDHLGIEFDQVD